jgi:CheY-like chemotaxis protein
MSSSSSPNAMSVLVVEDHRDSADSLALFLQECGGHDTEVAYDGDAGLRAALRHRPDAVICDLALPNKNGFAVAQELCSRLPYKPLLVAMSAYPEDAVRGRAEAAGFDHCLTKPADPSYIADLIETHFQHLAT